MTDKMELAEQKMEHDQIKQAGQNSKTVDTLPSKETTGASAAASTLSTEETSEAGDGKGKKKKGKEASEPVKAVGYLELYRFATPKEYLYIT